MGRRNGLRKRIRELIGMSNVEIAAGMNEYQGQVVFGTKKGGQFREINPTEADNYNHPSTGLYVIIDCEPIRFFATQVSRPTQIDSKLGTLILEGAIPPIQLVEEHRRKKYGMI